MVLVVAGANDSVNDEGKHDALLKRLLQDLSVKKPHSLPAISQGRKKCFV